jgi:putative transposase
MQPPVAAVIEAHSMLERLVAGLDDQQVAEASALPGWSRGHVLAHLTDNARMFARLAEHALRGELVATYDGGMDERNAIIAAGLPYPTSGELSRRFITEAKKTPERAWLGEVSAVVLQQSLRDLDAAYANFFASIKGTRRGPKVGEPRMKSKRDHRQAVRFTANARWSITPGGKLNLPKIGPVAVRWSRALPSVPSTVTVIKDAAGRYFASSIVETDPAQEILPPVEGDQGIDLGLTHFAVMADGSRVRSPRYLRRAEKKLRREQRRLSRKTKGSNNRDKQRVKVARAHVGVADARRDFHHKLSTKLIRENQAISVETLSVKGLARTRLAKSVHDAGWSAFVSMLEYKAARYGRTLTKVDRAFPSSQICSACGHRDGPKPPHIRAWTCGTCGARHGRDWNAAKNVKDEGRRIRAAT